MQIDTVSRVDFRRESAELAVDQGQGFKRHHTTNNTLQVDGSGVSTVQTQAACVGVVTVDCLGQRQLSCRLQADIREQGHAVIEHQICAGAHGCAFEMRLTLSIGAQARQFSDSSHIAFKDRGTTVTDTELMGTIHRRQERQIHALQLGVCTQKHPLVISLRARGLDF